MSRQEQLTSFVRKLYRECKQRGYVPHELYDGEQLHRYLPKSETAFVKRLMKVDMETVSFISSKSDQLRFCLIYCNAVFETIADYETHPVADEVAIAVSTWAEDKFGMID